MLTSEHRILMVSVEADCAAGEFDVVNDPLVEGGRSTQIHQWCLVTGKPGKPEPDMRFEYAYISAHGDQPGCSFCLDGRCLSKQAAMQQICPYLRPDALVVASCCWCGETESAIQVACACAEKVGEIVGPLGEITIGDMRNRTKQFFKYLASGHSHAEAAYRAELEHHIVEDLDLTECEP